MTNTNYSQEEHREEMHTEHEHFEEVSENEAKDYSVYPTFFFGGFWIRFFAYLFDSILATAAAKIIANPLAALFNVPMNNKIPTTYGFLMLFGFLAYFVLFTKFNRGQTPGKMLFGLRVVPLKEQELTWPAVLIREGCMRYVSKLFWIIYIIVPFSEKHQSVADLFADTAVIKENMLYTEAYVKENL